MSTPTPIVVRYGRMRFLGQFLGLPGQEHLRGQRVVVHTERGLELGEVLCRVTDRTREFLEPAPSGEIVESDQAIPCAVGLWSPAASGAT